MKTILVTRPAGDADPIVAELRGRGYEVVAVATVAIRPLAPAWPDLARFEWLVLTSAAGVATLPAVPAGLQVAAVGAGTAAALRARGVEVALVPREASGIGIAREIDPAGVAVLLVRASAASSDLPDALRRRGASVVEVVAYETVEGPAESAAPLRKALARGDVAAVVFASGSAARGYLALGGDAAMPAVTIGPRTSAVARDLGFTVAGEAAGASVEHLAAAVDSAARAEAGRDA